MSRKKPVNTFWVKVLWLIGLSRFLICFLIYKYPLLVVLVTLTLDDIDCRVAYYAGLSWGKYQVYDKLLDYWWYIFIVLFSVGKSIFPVILVLFLIRSIGQFLAIKNKNEIYFFYFPNVLEVFFVFYILATSLPQMKPVFQNNYPINALLFSLLITILREYWLHVGKFRPSNLFKLTAIYSRDTKW